MTISAESWRGGRETCVVFRSRAIRIVGGDDRLDTPFTPPLQSKSKRPSKCESRPKALPTPSLVASPNSPPQKESFPPTNRELSDRASALDRLIEPIHFLGAAISLLSRAGTTGKTQAAYKITALGKSGSSRCIAFWLIGHENNDSKVSARRAPTSLVPPHRMNFSSLQLSRLRAQDFSGDKPRMAGT